jgi:hypothetical protein
VTDRDFAEWDREIEVDFRREMRRQSEAARKRRMAMRHIGCPLEYFFKLARARNRTVASILVGMHLYRRHYLTNKKSTGLHKAVALSSTDLIDLGVSRWTAARALKSLEAAGLVVIQPAKRGRKARVMVSWPIE